MAKIVLETKNIFAARATTSSHRLKHPDLYLTSKIANILLALSVVKLRFCTAISRPTATFVAVINGAIIHSLPQKTSTCLRLSFPLSVNPISNVCATARLSFSLCYQCTSVAKRASVPFLSFCAIFSMLKSATSLLPNGVLSSRLSLITSRSRSYSYGLQFRRMARR